MKRESVTKDVVFNAADTIVDSGVEPTQKAVIDRCGGSFLTVGPMLRQWREAREARRARPVLPDAILDRLRAFSEELWTAAIDVTNRNAAEERNRVGRERAAMEEDRMEALNLVAAMEAAAREQAARLDETNQAVKAANAALDDLRSKLAAANERAAVAEACAQEIEMRAHGLFQELAHLGKQNAELVKIVGSMCHLARETPARGAPRH
jgi:chromosome segregation ATPase